MVACQVCSKFLPFQSKWRSLLKVFSAPKNLFLLGQIFNKRNLLTLTIPMALGVGLGGVLMTPIAAAPYPSKAIRLIVPFSPGGAGDLVARALSKKLTLHFQEAVVVDNRAGAGGIIGVQITAKSTADGYTLLLSTSSTQVIGPILQPHLPYDVVKDFTPISLAVLIPNILVTHPQTGITNLAELIALAKKKPSTLTYASNGNGTSSHLAGELFKEVAHIQWLHVPYKGAGLAINDLLGGHVDLLLGGISTSLPHIRTKRLRALAVTSLKRSSATPDIPSVSESGFAGFEVIQWFGVSGPSNLPLPLLKTLKIAIQNSLSAVDFKDQMTALGIEVANPSEEDFSAFEKKERMKWTKILKANPIQIDPPS